MSGELPRAEGDNAGSVPAKKCGQSGPRVFGIVPFWDERVPVREYIARRMPSAGREPARVYGWQEVVPVLTQSSLDGE